MVLHGEETGFSNTCRRACDLLAASPHLADTFSGKRPPRHTQRPALHDSLQHRRITNWDTIPPSLASAILGVISLSSLDRLHLINIYNLPQSLVYLAASLTSVLSLDGVYMGRSLAVDIRSAPSQLQLTHLILPSQGMPPPLCTFMRQLRKDGHLQQFRRFSLTLQASPYEDHLQIFAPLSGLHHLEIDCSRQHHGLLTIPRFELFRIHELTFCIGMARHLPDNLALLVSELPKAIPMIE
ncbi:hypothetical protein DFH09DRAFT_1371673 [Mycena vulgaris]|nr:hypothetical protein DFH09DRAFT_1371673 [Mycena vulgaris]